jgi:hypothetical protein
MSEQNYQDKSFSLLTSFTLTSGNSLLNQAIQLDKDADFFWTGLSINSLTGPSTLYQIRFQDSTGYYLSDDYQRQFSFYDAYGYGSPQVLLPGIHFPAGSAILVDLQGLNGTINVLVKGYKRFYK